MSDFINTIDLLGDDVVVDSIIDRTITEFRDDQIVTVDKYAFYGCTELRTVDLPSTQYLKDGAFERCTSLVEANLPNVTQLGMRAFSDCKNLSQLSLSNVTTMNGNAITNTAIRELRLPSVVELLANSLRGCPQLILLDLPTCTWVRSFALADDPKLTTLILRSATICKADANIFYMTKPPIVQGTGYIYVPRALIEDYKVAENWSTFASQFRVLEDYTVDGTTTGELDESKI